MTWRLRRRIRASYDELRSRMLAETSAFITEGLRRPEYAVRIPTVPVERACFPRSFARAFWDPILSESPS